MTDQYTYYYFLFSLSGYILSHRCYKQNINNKLRFYEETKYYVFEQINDTFLRNSIQLTERFKIIFE
jgi:hypothetical protein